MLAAVTIPTRELENGGNPRIKNCKYWGKEKITPVLPSLEPRFVENVVERLPIIEDLVAVVHDVRRGAHVTQQTESQQRQKPLETSPVVVIAAAGLLAGLVLLRVTI